MSRNDSRSFFSERYLVNFTSVLVSTFLGILLPFDYSVLQIRLGFNHEIRLCRVCPVEIFERAIGPVEYVVNIWFIGD